MTIDDILSQNPIVPVLNLTDEVSTRGIVAALQAGGLRCVEIALRTDFALQAIEIVRREFPDLLVGAGTLRRAVDFANICAAGAHFAVSPGATDELITSADHWDIPFLPAASTVSEIMKLSDAGFSTIKLFPAAEVGGIGFIKAVAGPLPDIRLVPSGGISAGNVSDYLAQKNVISVSGSWLTPGSMIAERDWDGITELVSATHKAQPGSVSAR